MDNATFDAFDGVFMAHVTHEVAGTGCTVIVVPEGATGGVDVAGGAPATRETDLLRPEETVEVVHAVVLSGGSAYGLAAATGVAEELERRDIGLDVGVCKVPIVVSACLFDLGLGDAHVRPGADDGTAAAALALDGAGDVSAQGNVGAGMGCTVGKFLGPLNCMKGGLGTSVASAGELLVGAVSAVNAVGSVFDPVTHEPIAGARVAPTSSEILPNPIQALAQGLAAQAAQMPLPRTNTTISCVVTNAKLTKAQCTKVAQMTADAYARAIEPAHTTNDGDTVFVLALGKVAAETDAVGLLAQEVVAEAIANGCRYAETAFGVPGAASGDEF